MKTGKRILAVVLTATMCVSSLGTVAMTSASAARKLQNNLWMDKSITVGKNEKCYLYYDVNEGLSDHLKATSDNSNVKVLHYSQGANYGNALIEGRNVGKANVHVEGKKSSDGIYTYGDCKVTVKPAPTSVRLSTTSLTLGVGETFTITESTNSGSYAKSFTWSSSNSKVATVTKDSGNKAIVKAVGKGTAYIKIKTYNGKTATCKVTVK